MTPQYLVANVALNVLGGITALMTYIFESLESAEIKPISGVKKRFLVRLRLRAIERTDAVEFEVNGRELMALMSLLQSAQVRHRIPAIRPPFARGKPQLRVVKPDE